MDITDYDEYIPEKELNMNFRIPRKRTVEESSGGPAESPQFDTNTKPLSAYSGLSGAASRASAYSNYRGPVPYTRPDVSKLDTSVEPPTISTNQNTSIGASQYSNTGTNRMIEYPKTTPSAIQYSNAGFYRPIEYPKTTSSLSSLLSGKWGQDFSGSLNRTDSKFVSTWSGSSNNDSFSGQNRSQGSSWNSGQERNRDSWRSEWGNTQATKWNNRQESEGGNTQATKWNNKQESEGGNKQATKWNNRQVSEWNDTQESKWNNRQESEWNDTQESKWNNRQESEWNDTQASKWNNRQESEWNDTQESKWNNRQESESNNRQESERGNTQMLKWNNRQDTEWSPKWNSSQGDRNGPSGDNSLFNRNREYTDRPRPAQKPFSWNGSGNDGGNSFNRSFRGRGGMRQGGFRNEGNDEGNFGRGMSVLDNEDTSYGDLPGWKPRNFQDGQNSNERYWNKSEKPKKPKISTPPVVISDTADETLPKDLRMMFQPLFCKLCSIQMTSNVMAKMHYVSKNHEKKIRKYLIDHSEKTGEPLHPRAAVTAAQGKKDKEEDKDPKHFYCELCDLQLTGKQHAESHYMGKSHNAVRMGRKRPAGQGFYDENGKWIRKNKEAKLEYAEGEDTFGMDFKKKSEENEAPSVAVSNPQPVAKTTEQFSCSICVISCVSQDQLNIHFSGAKHKKKLRLNGVSPENFTLPESTEEKESEVNTTNIDATTSNDGDESLKTKYMTPNGFYYCEKCNITVNSEVQFKQHLGSKNHAKKANAAKTVA